MVINMVHECVSNLKSNQTFRSCSLLMTLWKCFKNNDEIFTLSIRGTMPLSLPVVKTGETSLLILFHLSPFKFDNMFSLYLLPIEMSLLSVKWSKSLMIFKICWPTKAWISSRERWHLQVMWSSWWFQQTKTTQNMDPRCCLAFWKSRKHDGER